MQGEDCMGEAGVDTEHRLEDPAGQSKKAGFTCGRGSLWQVGFEEGTWHGSLDGVGGSLCKQWQGGHSTRILGRVAGW